MNTVWPEGPEPAVILEAVDSGPFSLDASDVLPKVIIRDRGLLGLCGKCGGEPRTDVGAD